MTALINWDLARDGIYQITNQIFVGQYPKAEALKRISELGIKTILNVSGGVYGHPDFDVINIPVEDLAEMPLITADKIVTAIKATVNAGDKIYVHCIAGQNRSPGAVFIGLLSLGISEPQAIALIEDSTLDSVPKHEKIITDKVVKHVLRNVVI